MNQTFQNSAQVLSIGIFFTLLIIGLASSLPRDAEQRPARRTASSAAAAHQAGADAADLGPLRRLPRLQPDPAPGRRRTRCTALPAHAHAVLTGHAFFPHLISGPFSDGLDTAFAFAIVACLIAAARLAAARRPLPPRRGAGPARRALAGQIPKLEEQHAR